MVILGIDPGTATTGYGVIETSSSSRIPKLLDFGVISTPAGMPEPERLSLLGQDFKDLLKEFRPAAVGVEKLFFTKNQKTAIAVAQARGIILFLSESNGLLVEEFTPLQVKSFICGYGKAEKSQVQFMVQKIFALKTKPKPDDAADALAVALCAAHFTQKNKKIARAK